MAVRSIPGGNFVFLALHYQPERTTCPDGGRYNNQLLVAALIANNLPPDWHMCIKEHPSQFNYQSNGHQSRSLEYYTDLLSLPQTILIDQTVPTNDVLARSRAVATVTGVVGWEALARGIPALVFGAAWYSACRGAFPIRDEGDLHKAFDSIAGGFGQGNKMCFAMRPR